MLWSTLKKSGFASLKTKHCNQDPLKNLFGLIRDSGGQSTKPTCYQFIGHFKAIVINNLAHYHTRGANCEDDRGAFLLSWQKYLQFEDETSNDLIPWPKITSPNPRPKIIGSNNPIPQKGKVLATTALLLKNLKKKAPSIDSCPTCMSLLSCGNRSSSTGVTIPPINEVHRDVNGLLDRIMNSIYANQGVQDTATKFLRREIRDDIVTCHFHRDTVFTNFLKCTIQLYILSMSLYINLILRGKLNFNDSQDNASQKPRRNQFVQAAITKRQKSLHKKNMTVCKLRYNKRI